MRPRVSQKEAAYLVQVLQLQIGEMKEKLENVKQLERDYARIIYDLKHRVQRVCDDKGYFKEHRIVGDREAISLVRLARALKEEHPSLLGEKFLLWDCLSTHEKMLKKYRAIAEGQPHDGRYKHLSVADAVYPKFKLASILNGTTNRSKM